MKELILKLCEEIESKYNIKILFCVESGSRAWGLNSKDSDYDVRFVFKRPIKDYVKVNSSSEVITCAYDEKGVPMEPKGAMIDFQGFDILKFTRMVKVSNPTVIEWLISNIIYVDHDLKEDFKCFIENNFKAASLYYHYKSMCKQNYIKYLKDGSKVTYKKYLYAMRGLLNSKYVALYKGLPPLKFEQTITRLSVNDFIPDFVYDSLKEIIEAKRKGTKNEKAIKICKIDNYIESQLKDLSNEPLNIKKHDLTLELDELVWGVLK